MEPFTAAAHEDVLRLVLEVAILLFAARAMGEVARRLGQPSVVGEIAAGILLGPSLLSGFVPALGHWIVPQTAVQGYLLEVISLIGAMFMMLITGFETDLGLIRRHARTAVGVSLCGIAATFTTGYFLGRTLPDFLMSSPNERMVFALFLGTAMAISAIAVIAKVIMDLGLMRRDIGQTLIAAGMSDDTVGWIILSMVAGLAGGGVVSAGTLVKNGLSVIVFIVLSVTVGGWLMRRLVDFVLDRVGGQHRFLTLVMVGMFTWGAIAQSIHLEAVLGAFVIGIVFGEIRRLPDETADSVEGVALGIFAPVFFAVAGLKVNLRHLFEPRLIGVALLVIGATALAKGVGTYTGARLIGRKDHWTSLSFSAGLNTRGAMDIIIATIGLELSVFSQDMFSILVLMAMTNALLAPTVLRWVLGKVNPSEEELKRLEDEERAEDSLVAGIHRVLLPIRLRDTTHNSYRIESALIERMARKSPIALTLLTVTRPGEKEKGQAFLDRVSELFPQKELRKKVVVGSSPSELILDEAEKEYDLLVLGATEASSQRVLFNPMVDYLIRVSPCPTMIVKSPPQLDDWAPHTVLVPTNGTHAARLAAEIAFSLATGEQDRVIALTVVGTESGPAHLDVDGRMYRRQLGSARQIVRELRELGEAQGVQTDDEVLGGADAESLILGFARSEEVDLIILGTDLRPGSQRLFLGPKVERILTNAPCPVIVFNAS